MRILKDFKIPDFKFPKFKMKNVENIEEVNVDYEELKRKQEDKLKNKYHEQTNYKTIKEIFINSRKQFAEDVFILEKFNSKEPFTEITFKEFTDDVIAFGTGITKKYKLKDERIVIIGENTYCWYVSYMAMLCGAGVAVPVDKELPPNEIENVIKRAKATAIIYSTKKKEVIKKIEDSLPEIKYFIQMNSDDKLVGRTVGFNTILKQGKKMVGAGDNSFMKIEVNPEEFKVLIFTSGTTSNAKGVMINNRNLAQNINAVNPYVKIGENDRLFSVLPLHHTYESTIGFLLPFSTGTSIAVCQGLKYIVPNLQETNPTAIIAVGFVSCKFGTIYLSPWHTAIDVPVENGNRNPIVDS